MYNTMSDKRVHIVKDIRKKYIKVTLFSKKIILPSVLKIGHWATMGEMLLDFTQYEWSFHPSISNTITNILLQNSFLFLYTYLM